MEYFVHWNDHYRAYHSSKWRPKSLFLFSERERLEMEKNMIERCKQLLIYLVFVCAMTASIASSGFDFPSSRMFVAKPVYFSLSPKRRTRRFITTATLVTDEENVKKYGRGLDIIATYLFSIKKGETGNQAIVEMSLAAVNELLPSNQNEDCFARPATCRWTKKRIPILGENTGNTTIKRLFREKETYATTKLYIKLELTGDVSVTGSFNYKFIARLSGKMGSEEERYLNMSFVFREVIPF